MSSPDKSTFLIVSTVAAAFVMIASVLCITSVYEEFAPKDVHFVIPQESKTEAAAYTLTLKMAGTSSSSAVDYARRLFGVCCNCTSARPHTSQYIDRALEMIIEEEAAVKAVASMFTTQELDNTVYLGITAILENELPPLPSEPVSDDLITSHSVDDELVVCSNSCCQD